MKWPIYAFRSVPEPLHVVPVERTQAVVKDWKGRAVEHYKTATQTVRKHPYLASGLLLLSMGVLLKGVNGKDAPLQSTEASSSSMPPMPTSIPVPPSITPQSQAIPAPEVESPTIISTSSLPDPLLATTHSIFDIHFPSADSVGHIIHDIVSSVDTTLTEERHRTDESKNEEFIEEKKLEPLSEFVEEIDQLTANPLDTLTSFFKALDPEPQPYYWHSPVTTHEHFSTAMQIAASAIISLILHFLRVRNTPAPYNKYGSFIPPIFIGRSQGFLPQYNTLCNLKTAFDFDTKIRHLHSEHYENDLLATCYLTDVERNELIIIASRQLCRLTDNLPPDIIPSSICARR